MTEHVLKTLPQYWDAVQRGDKTFEVRRDDRGFQRGDVLVLCRTKDPALTGWKSDEGKLDTDPDGNARHVIQKRITYVLTGGQFGVEPGYVVLALGDPDGV